MGSEDRSKERRGTGDTSHAQQLADAAHEQTAKDAARSTPEAADAPETGPAPAGEAAVDYRDRWLRTEADFQNYRRRAQKDLEEAVRFAEDRLLLDTIAQLDDLERALGLAGEAGGGQDAWVQGVRLVANRMLEDLARRDVTPMQPIGQPFDPELHEALLEIDAPEGVEPGTVVQVVRQGYRRGARALRAARVVVARRPGEGN